MKFLKEPLIHFLLIGVGIFLLYNLAGNKSESEDRIIIDDSELNHMVSIWKLQWQRDPTEEELIGLIERNIEQEVLYREALKMNLDHNDEVVKRRLAQKMQFLSEDFTKLFSEITDEQLKQYYEENADNYRLPYAHSFYHIVFNPDKRNDAYGDAQHLLSDNPNATVDDLKNKGDRLPFPLYYEDTDVFMLQKELGGSLAGALETLEMNQWAGPIQSGYGWHLVYIVDRNPPSLPDFADIKPDLKRDYEYELNQKSQEAIYKELKSNYEIVVEVESINSELTQRILEKINS